MQLELFDKGEEVQFGERLAPTPIRNVAHGKVTSHVKPAERRQQAATQVKVSSPEIIIVPQADAFHLAEGNTPNTVTGRGKGSVAGSESVACCHKDHTGTRETQHTSADWFSLSQVLRSMQRRSNKPIDGKDEGKVCWESDQPIVPVSSEKSEGGKGLTEMRRVNKDTSAIPSDGSRVGTKLLLISEHARSDTKMRFTSLAHLLEVDFLKGCFWELKRDKASGVDGVTVEAYCENLTENLTDLVMRIKSKSYYPQPLKRVYIPKSGGGERPIGIPALEDKVVQMGIKRILEVIYEQDFEDFSYGFRPNRSCHDALDRLDKTIMRMPINYIVDVDIEKFFDSVSHHWMMECLKVRIADPNLLQLIGRILRSGVIEDGHYQQTDCGTPQGGILSPLLANIYLHYVLDIWFERSFKKHLKGYGELIRYADDFVVCFQAKTEAEAFMEALSERLHKFGLKISQHKSQIIAFGRYVWYKAQNSGERIATFDFLGFTHYCDKTRNGYFKLGRRTSRKKLRDKLKEMNQWLKRVRNAVELKQWWQTLRAKLLGYFRYYGISGNMPQMKAFYTKVVRLAFKWINRRSQKKSYNWKQFNRFLEYNPLPKPKIYHNIYTLKPC